MSDQQEAQAQAFRSLLRPASPDAIRVLTVMQDQVEACGLQPPPDSFWLMTNRHVFLLATGLPSMAVRFQGVLAQPLEREGQILTAFGRPVTQAEVPEPLLVRTVR